MIQDRIPRACRGIGSAVLLAVLLTGCQDKPRWNVLVVTFDTTRADRLGCYGNDAIQTPTLDGLASQGVRFERAYSAVPITTPSHSTIMTGKYPLAHGVRDNGKFILDERNETLAERLQKAGYATAASVASFPLIAKFGLGQGFDFYDDRLPGRRQDLDGRVRPRKRSLFFDERRAAQVNEAILPWLDEHVETRPSQSFFMWVHYFDPHQPFVPPAPYDQLYAHDLYDGEIAYTDASLGRLLDRMESLGVLDRTLVVMTADHGEGRGEHNEITHAILAYNSTLHVPLIIRPPGKVAPRVVSEPVATADIVPTILELLGLPVDDSIQGQSLVSLFDGETPLRRRTEHEERPIYAENLSPRISHYWGELRALYADGKKYIHGPRPELFDLEADPGERNNLIDAEPELTTQMQRRLHRFLEEKADPGMSVPQAMSPEVLERLRGLGYLQGGGDQEEIVEELRSDGIPPQDRVVDINNVSRAKNFLHNRQYLEAREHILKLLEANPDNPFYLELWASTVLGLGDPDEAWETLKRLRGADAVSTLPERLVLQLATVRFAQGELEDAIDLLRASQEVAPKASVQHLLANLLVAAGEGEAAAAELRRALEIDPTHAPSRVELAVLQAQAGAEEEAEAGLRQALHDDPYFPQAHFNLGTLLARQNRAAEATEAFQRAVDLAPSYVQAHHALVVVHLALGDLDSARLAYEVLAARAPDSPATEAARRLVENG